ncbi:hypothetical protein LNV08_13230 [Paucibacter sp. TC2R-5]|uniref:hypothetical protein n=1 Tax=Paucibacter sp. TC2R-5 TaxID=2893555 RepID=UPI0021E42D59|nr:hypothetical protein [Paucibacter sp. TC2R-5]MCV2359934.1 hypothetical protein [Paucibacter sp. TC2R-5]
MTEEIDPQKLDIWFPAKRYGWGWGLPVRWQGWLVLSAYAILMVWAAFLLSPEQQPLSYSVSVAVLTALLLLICWCKGERPRWRWGDEKPS